MTRSRIACRTSSGLAALVAFGLTTAASHADQAVPEPPPRPFDLPTTKVSVALPPPVAAQETAVGPGVVSGVAPSIVAGPAAMRPLIARHAAANQVPEALVHRVIQRESRYNPRAVGSGGAMGLMQIKLGTARRMGYTGDAQGLLDADTNMRYAVPYLAGAYRVAGGNHDQAVRNYASGYYYQAKAKGLLSVYQPVSQRAR